MKNRCKPGKYLQEKDEEDHKVDVLTHDEMKWELLTSTTA